VYECEFHGAKDLDDDNDDEDHPRFQTLQWNFGKKERKRRVNNGC